MTRQRIRPSLKRSIYRDCPICEGRGLVKSTESMAIEVVRLLILGSQDPKITKVVIRVAEDVTSYLNNKKRRELAQIEDEGQLTVHILGNEGHEPEFLQMEYFDKEGNEVVALQE